MMGLLISLTPKEILSLLRTIMPAAVGVSILTSTKSSANVPLDTTIETTYRTDVCLG